MRKFITGCAVVIVSSVFSQNMQVQNMANYLRNKDYEKAKASADAAAEHESTKTSSKMWMYRGNVYKAIYSDTSQKVRDIDSQAEEKSLEAYINCFKYDEGKVYSDPKSDYNVKGGFVSAASATKRKAYYYMDKKDYDNALHCFDLLEQALPYDFDQGLKRQNITKEKIMFEKFEMYKAAGNKEKTKEYANKLIEIKYKDPKIYTDMVRISLIDKDTAAALDYIAKGKILFEDNMTLIGSEIDIYIARKQTNVLKDKLKSAIEIAPDNELLYVVLGQVCEKTGDTQEAEKSYLKALEIKPEMESANYKLGALYFNTAVEYNDKYNDLPPKETAKAKEYEAKVKENFTKAIPYLEKAYEINPDPAYKQRLFQANSRIGNREKAALYK